MLQIVLVVLVIAMIAARPAAAADEFELPPGATIVAGTGAAATDETRGDGGPATGAAFDRIVSIDRMGDDSLLIADSFDGRIRRIAPDGSISTNAGPDQELQHPVAVVGTTWAPGAPLTPNGFAAADYNNGVGQVAMWSQVESVPGELNSIHLERMTMTPDEDEASDVDRAGDGSGFVVAQSGVPLADNGRVLFVRFNSVTNR